MEQKVKRTEELAVRTYLDSLDKIGLYARLFMIADCENAVLHRAHVVLPTVHEPWRTVAQTVAVRVETFEYFTHHSLFRYI